MTAENQIRHRLELLMPVADANACGIFKGYSHNTGKTGWHYIRFGRTATFIGTNLADALKWIEAEFDHQAHS